MAMSVHSEAAATDRAQPEEVAREVAVATVEVAAAADVEEDPEAAALEEVPEAVAVVVESPRIAIHTDDNHNQSSRGIDY